jgi:hypothetical protein
MFVQVITGRTNDIDGVRRQMDRWRDDVRPGAIGFLGSTVGVTSDGTFIAIARFADEAAAKANNERAEQSAWFEETAKYFDGQPTFRESSDTRLMFDGGSDKAGFVQIMEGSAKDKAKVDGMETPEMLAQLRAARPDLMGALRVWLPGNTFVEAAYFTSEKDARAGESSSDFEGPGQEYADLFGEMRYTDLRDPILIAP